MGVAAGAGGGTPMMPMMATPQPTAGFDVNRTAAGALQQAIGGTQRAVGNTGLLTSMVTNQTLADLERQRQMQQNQLGMQASSAGAYGGSRHGVAEALTNEAFARQGAQALGNLQLGQQQALMRGSAQLGQLGQQAFTTGRTIGQDLATQGLLQQALQQQLIDAARGQYAGYIGQPERSMALPLQALGAVPYPSTTRDATQPGLFSYLQFAAGLPGMFPA